MSRASPSFFNLKFDQEGCLCLLQLSCAALACGGVERGAVDPHLNISVFTSPKCMVKITRPFRSLPHPRRLGSHMAFEDHFKTWCGI